MILDDDAIKNCKHVDKASVTMPFTDLPDVDENSLDRIISRLPTDTNANGDENVL